MDEMLEAYKSGSEPSGGGMETGGGGQPPRRRGGIGKVLLFLVLVLVLVGAGFGGAVLFLGSQGDRGSSSKADEAVESEWTTTSDEPAESVSNNSAGTTGERVGTDNEVTSSRPVKALEGRVTGGNDWGWGGATYEDRVRVLERAHDAVGRDYALGGEMALLRECWGPEGIEFPLSLGGEGRGWGLFDELRESTGGNVVEARYVSAGDILIIGDVVSDKSVNVATAGIYVGGGEMVCCLSPDVADRAGLESGVVLVDVDSAGGYALASAPLR